MMLIRSKWNLCGISRVYGAVFYSQYHLRSHTQMRSSPPVHSLFLRISRAGDPKISMARVLDQWVQEGRSVKPSHVHKIIKQLRAYGRLNHALQVSEWVSNQMNYDLSHADIAIRLDLISKVHGLDQAERYFSSIPETSRGYKLYGALLNCYAQHKSLENAEATVQKIKEFGFICGAVSYNVLLNLYARMGEYEKLDSLTQEMKQMGICDSYTYSIRLNAYVMNSDIRGMEMFLKQIEADGATVEWYAYRAAANAYLKAGLSDKALAMLKRSEQLIKDNMRRVAYESLLTMYAASGEREEVYRIWNMYKNLERSHSSGYVSMLSSLVKLDDLNGAETLLEEWKSENTCFDVRIPNLLISAYCKKGLLEKAEAFVGRTFKSGMNLDGSTWFELATGYCRHNHMEKAVEMLKKTILANGHPEVIQRWRPNPFTLSACMEYLKGKEEVEFAVDILKLYRDGGLLSEATYERLLYYVNYENQDTRALEVLEIDFPSEENDQPADGREELGKMDLMEDVSN